MRRMSNDAPRVSLLEEIDARQNELLDELERLNGRIERVITEWSARGEGHPRSSQRKRRSKRHAECAY